VRPIIAVAPATIAAMPLPAVSLIAAVARDGGIGHRGELLVRIPEDLRRFRQITLGAPIVMGRKTWQSIGRPLPGRRNIVVSRNPSFRAEGAETAASLEEALRRAAPAPRVHVIGGAELYVLALPIADTLELTEVDAEFPADVFFPDFDRSRFALVARAPHETAEGLRYAFATYKKATGGV